MSDPRRRLIRWLKRSGRPALNRYLAFELADKNIRVNAVSAASVETETMKLYTSDPNIPKPMITSTPAGRMVQPEDIADTVAFLCSEEASMIRGQVIVVDGGVSLSSMGSMGAENGGTNSANS